MKEVKITPKKKEALAELDLYTSEDIINYFPYRYEKIEFLDYALWKENDKVVIEGIVTSKPKIFRFGKNKSVISFELTNDYNSFRISVFNQMWYLKMPVGEKVTVIGKYEGHNKIVASAIKKESLEEVCGIKPVYSLKDKLKPNYFSQLIERVLEANEGEIETVVPEYLLEKYDLIDKYQALREIHFPTSSNHLTKSLETIKYEEFLKFQCIMLYRKQRAHVRNTSYRKQIDAERLSEFENSLPFRLTNDQKKSVSEIVNDMRSDYQMTRLLQGDVGSGKTIVSFIAMYAAYLSGMQACLMAPTEILAKQHYNNICRIFAGYDVNIALLYSSIPSQQKKELLNDIACGRVDFIVGTHAVFQQDVVFKDLGLIVIDEQHRFGVKQRQLLQEKGEKCDILLMSATPIPRTLATSLYGDLDVSTITETPNAGKKIHTVLIKKNSFMAEVKQIEKLLAQGNQMYVICAAIEKNEDFVARNVTDIYHNLSQYFKGRYTVGLLHGQLSEEEKDAVQDRFASGEIDILVSTTVVEVGVDVRNANIMIIYDANRFGLSQLHQLRGRVGRGEREGYCYLLTGSTDEEAIERLNVLVNNTDGFKISYYDLKLRGPGDILGYRQSGLPTFLVGNVVDDIDLLQKSRDDAQEIIQHLNSPENENIRDYLIKAVQENDQLVY